MYQILSHALADPTNKTKFTLLFGNVEERDILLRDDFEKLAKAHPDTFKVVHVLGTAPENWKGQSGFITSEMMKKEFAPPSENVKVLVCGTLHVFADQGCMN
jgi:cytochrome-b5 reductase